MFEWIINRCVATATTEASALQLSMEIHKPVGLTQLFPLQYKPCGGAPLTRPKAVAITRPEVVRRIHRSLKQDDPFHLLRRSRSARAQLDLGDYYVVDLIREFVVHRDVALEAEARKRRVLADFEYLAN
jgi:hypothetical protein